VAAALAAVGGFAAGLTVALVFVRRHRDVHIRFELDASDDQRGG
jgi:hypothetical protein